VSGTGDRQLGWQQQTKHWNTNKPQNFSTECIWISSAAGNCFVIFLVSFGSSFVLLSWQLAVAASGRLISPQVACAHLVLACG